VNVYPLLLGDHSTAIRNASDLHVELTPKHRRRAFRQSSEGSTGNATYYAVGSEIPLDPFFGIIATAPPPSWGRCGSPVPRAFGGNMDNKELRTTLYLPVFNEGGRSRRTERW
jgi:acetamidase/formamidase